MGLFLAMQKVSDLRRQEAMDPPIPARIVDSLDTAESDIRLLTFKYAVLGAVVGGERAKDGSQGGAQAATLTEEALKIFMEKHVRFGQRPGKSKLAASPRSLSTRTDIAERH